MELVATPAAEDARVLSRKQYLREYYAKNKDKWRVRAPAQQAKYVEKWANATEEELAERRKKCNEYAEKTKPWKSRRERRPVAYLLNVARQRCKRTGTEFCITEADLTMPTHCPLLGTLLDTYAESVDVHPSIDRINPALGYVPGNVWIISHRANRIKSNATFAELITIGLALQERVL
jgi:hypothetical protein